MQLAFSVVWRLISLNLEISVVPWGRGEGGKDMIWVLEGNYLKAKYKEMTTECLKKEAAEVFLNMFASSLGDTGSRHLCIVRGFHRQDYTLCNNINHLLFPNKDL